MVAVGTDAGSISHHVGDVVLLVDAVKQVCHGALGEDCHVLPAMGLMPQGHSRLRLVVVVSCGREETFAEGPAGVWCWAPPGLAQMPHFTKEKTEAQCREGIPHKATGFGPESILT